MSTFTRLDSKVARLTLVTSFDNAVTLADNLTDVACSAVLNFWEELENPSLCGFVMNQCTDHKERAKIRRITNATKIFIGKFVGMQPKKDDDGKTILKNKDGVIYQKNQDKVDQFRADAAAGGFSTDTAGMIAYITGLMDVELGALGGTILGKKAKKDKYEGMTETEKAAAEVQAAVDSFDRSCKSGNAALTITQLKAVLDSHGILEAIAQAEEFQKTVTNKS